MAMSSAAEFVEGGIQDPCEDACSICLEGFCAENPPSVTGCNHEYHLQCILEWVQRSSDCPMCWQPLVMKDAIGQELLQSTEQERSFRANQSHTSLLPHLRSSDLELDQFASFEERLMRHLAAASAHQAHGQRWKDFFNSRPSVNDYPERFIYVPNPTSATTETSEPGSEDQLDSGNSHSTFVVGATRSRNSNVLPPHLASAGSVAQGASTSDVQSFSDAIKSRFSAASSKYKETFSKTAKLFREKMRARNANSDLRVSSPNLTPRFSQAPGKMPSREFTSRSGDTEETSDYASFKNTILEKRQTENLPMNFGFSILDADKSTSQSTSRNSSQPSVVTNGSSDDRDVKLTSLRGGESIAAGKKAMPILESG